MKNKKIKIKPKLDFVNNYNGGNENEDISSFSDNDDNNINDDDKNNDILETETLNNDDMLETETLNNNDILETETLNNNMLETETNNEFDSSDDELNNNDIINDDDNNNIVKKLVNNNERITNNFMSKYEFTRVLSIRTTQIERGASVLLKNSNELKKIYSPQQLAILELQNKTCPLYIIREIPNGNIEKWDVNELIIKKDYLRL